MTLYHNINNLISGLDFITCGRTGSGLFVFSKILAAKNLHTVSHDYQTMLKVIQGHLTTIDNKSSRLFSDHLNNNCKSALAAEPKDPFTTLESLAAKGEPDAQNRLGLYYWQTLNPPFPEEAKKWFRLAADQGDAMGQANLAFTLLSTDKSESLKYYKLSAAQGFPTGQCGLAKLLIKSTGQVPNPEAVRLLYLSAKAGHLESQVIYAEICEHGYYGQEKKLAKAREYYERASWQGSEIGRDGFVRVERQRKDKMQYFYPQSATWGEEGITISPFSL